MRLAAQPWLRVVFFATVLVFAVVAVYVFGVRYFGWLESDAAVPTLLADRALNARAPIVPDWYYANGELWVIAPHLFSLIPVALLGVGPITLLVATVFGFVVELAVVYVVYSRFVTERWVAVLATVATLMAWSNAHVAYTYVQLAYGFGTCLYLVVFGASATVANRTELRVRSLVMIALLVAAFTAQMPPRSLAYVIAPQLAACAWPWRAVPVHRRLGVAAALIGGWVIGYAVYSWLLSPVVAWSFPRGHVAFAFAGVHQISDNLAVLGRGLAMVCAGGREPSAWATPGAVVLAGALALVGRQVLARDSTPLRWLCVAILAQLGLLLAVLILGNVLDSPEATRYLIPSLLAMVGAAIVTAVGRAGETGWWRRVAICWLIALPIAALVAAREAGPPDPVQDVWPDAGELETVAQELVHRGLTHGFASNLAANLLTLDSHGAALTCRVTFFDAVMPQRWLGSTDCYAASALPDRFYIVAYQIERDRAALRKTLPPAIERFAVGDTYEVHVYSTEPASTGWLDLPIPDGDRAQFPIRLAATHLQLRRAEAAVERTELVATGTAGTVVYGPYLELPTGNYTASWIGEGIESPGTLAFVTTGVPAGRAQRQLARTVTLDAAAVPRHRGELVRIAFALKRATTGIELAVRSRDGARVSLHELVIERH